MRRYPWSAVLRASSALTLISCPAFAQQSPVEDPVQSAADARPAAAKAEASPKKKKRDLLIAPVPLSSPSTGTGIAVGGVAFYNPNNEPQQWISGAGVVYTDRGTKGLAGFHSMSFGQDRLRFKGVLSYIESRNNYYGIGDAAGERDERIELRNKQLSVQLQGLMQVFPHGYFGVRYHLTTNHAHPEAPEEDAPPVSTLPPPDDQLGSTLSVLGGVFTYDSRDSANQPRRGIYVNANWLFGIKALGDSFAHNKLQLAGNLYFPFGPRTVFATRATLCAAGGDVPYYDLCQFGSGPDLRGYEAGRYRDRASWALQGELRHRISSRFGGVVFFGLGGIAPSAGSILDGSDLLPAAGIGARYRPFRDNDVQLRLDVAVGKNDHGVYFGISEAF
jgi:outer membrane protein assembly factor BamA